MFVQTLTTLVANTRNLFTVKCLQLSHVFSKTFCTNQILNHVTNPAWKLGRLNHIAIVVPDLSQSVSMYRDMLGAKVSEPEDLPDHGVTVVFIELGNTKLELLYPLGEKSPVSNFLQKNKSGGMHHICIEVDDIHAAMEDLKTKKVRLLSESPKIGAHGNPVVFLHPKFVLSPLHPPMM